VTDDDGATGQVSHAVTPVAPPANVPPTASFTAGVTGRALAVDGSGSSDSDGSIASYAWSFGDGTTGAGVTAAHSYAQAGQYTVQLTVTDDDGATGTSSRVVTATNDPVTVARDTFGRTAANGWGAAELGGAWTAGGSSGDFAVNGGQGRVTLPAASAGRTIRLAAVSAVDTDVRLDASLDKLPAGSGTNATVSAIARSAGSSDYRLQLRVMASGAADLRLLRIENFGTTVVATAPLPGLQYTPGSVVHLRLQATGTAPTTLSGRAWLDGQAEPSAWQVQATDATAALQQAGGVGVHSALAASVTNVPIVVSIDNVVAQALQP
jgi:hypothetical protein